MQVDMVAEQASKWQLPSRARPRSQHPRVVPVKLEREVVHDPSLQDSTAQMPSTDMKPRFSRSLKGDLTLSRARRGLAFIG